MKTARKINVSNIKRYSILKVFFKQLIFFRFSLNWLLITIFMLQFLTILENVTRVPGPF